MNPSDFASLGLVEPVLSAVKDEGYTIPTPIQVESVPAVLAGRDLLGIAQTGTGKTAAFALPLIQRMLADPRKHNPRTCRILVVAPTRELAAQIDQSFAVYGKGANLSRACVFGGVGSIPQERALVRGVDVLTATPGRLLDLIDRGHLILSLVETVVLDEADRMFDMGFIRDVKRIVALLPAKRQTLLFSATMPPEIEAFADPILTDPVRVAVPSAQPTADRVDQKVLFVAKDDKRRLLAAILKEDGFERVLIFTKTKHGANRLVKQLAVEGIEADAIHANKSQNQRTRTMDAFRTGKVMVLVATDLAARGIDVDDIELVVNFDLPNEPETYIHRIGRTARAGAEGIAVSFCDSEERTLLRDIERLVGFRIPVELDHPFRLEVEPLRDERPTSGRPPRPAPSPRSKTPNPRGQRPGQGARSPQSPDSRPHRTGPAMSDLGQRSSHTPISHSQHQGNQGNPRPAPLRSSPPSRPPMHSRPNNRPSRDSGGYSRPRPPVQSREPDPMQSSARMSINDLTGRNDFRRSNGFRRPDPSPSRQQEPSIAELFSGAAKFGRGSPNENSDDAQPSSLGRDPRNQPSRDGHPSNPTDLRARRHRRGGRPGDSPSDSGPESR